VRDRLQLELTVGEYQDARRAERARVRVRLERELEAAAADGAEWRRWLLERWRPFRLGQIDRAGFEEPLGPC
jgi:hypothetical protein